MLGFLKKALEKTSENIHETVREKKSRISREEFEEILLEADAGYELIERLLEGMSESVNRSQAFNSLISVFQYRANWIDPDSTAPFVEMIIGVNGAGKTTSIAKLAHLYAKEGKSVILGAGDTFRAAAIEQLKRWAEKLNIALVSTRQGHDPSAVVYDTIKSAIARNTDRVIIDTAGRLHTQVNLAEELKKMVRVADKALPGAPHRKMLILDGTQGSSAVNQARVFNEMIGIDGIIITKLDGTAKGGAVLSIADELKMPIYYIGTGESVEDLVPFRADNYINAILDLIFK